MFHVQSTGILSRPMDQLLHYPVPKKPIENFHLHVRSFLPFLSICYIPQYMDCDANDFTGNHGNELYRRSPGVPQETHHGHGCHIHPKYDGENTVLIAALYVPFPLLSPLPLLLPLFLLFPIFSSFLLFFPPCFQGLTHSTPQPLRNKSNQSPLLVHPSSESYLARRLLCPVGRGDARGGRTEGYGCQHERGPGLS